MEKARVVALGGLNEAGKNCYCLEVDGDIFVIECGLKYPSVTNPGIDFVIPNFDYLRKNANRVKAVIVTHAHDGQFGALPYLLNLVNVPVYASAPTITMIRMAYSRRFRKFGTYRFNTVVPSSTVTIAGHVFDFFETTHSTPSSFGFALHTEAGNIVYTSAFMSDFSHNGNYSFDMTRMCRIAESGNTLLLMAESEGALLPGTASPRHRLTPFIDTLLENATGPSYFAVYTSDLFHIEEIIKTAVKHNKVVFFATPLFNEYLRSFQASGDLAIPQGHYAPLADIKSVPPKDRVIIVTGSGLKLFSDLKELAYGARKEDGLSLGPSDNFVMACPSVPGTEVQHTEALDTVFATGAKVLNITRRDMAAMHAQQEDLKMMITVFKPKYYLPVEGQFRQLMANAKTAVDMEVGLNHRNIFVYDNGMVLKFDEAGNFIPDPEKIPAADVVVDGNIVGQVKDSVLEERAKMSSDGVILMGALVSLRHKKQLSAPDIQMRGFIYLKDAAALLQKVNDIFSTTIDQMLNTPNRLVPLAEIQKKVGDKISRYLKKETDKEPLVICVIRNADEAERSQVQRAQAKANRANGQANRTRSAAQRTPTVPAAANLDLPSPRKPVSAPAMPTLPKVPDPNDEGTQGNH